jgi:hypothetical protein
MVLGLWWLKRWRGQKIKMIMAENNGGEADFSSTLAFNFLMLRTWNALLYIGDGSGIFVFIGAKSFPLIRTRRIPTVGSKLSS